MLRTQPVETYDKWVAGELNQAFWKGITDWVSGNRDLDGALQDIDKARK